MYKAVGVLVAVGCVALSGCDVDQTKEGEMPKVEVNASGGQLPEYNVQGPEVKVGTENTTVTVPEVQVGTEEKKVEVPKVDVDTPN